jgi:hypothetical protein
MKRPLTTSFGRRLRCLRAAAVTLVLLFSLARAPGFALLGPYADWMNEEIGYQFQGDIGGPMNFHEGYRWNMPVLTYGFERSFLDYFGSNGVAAVEAAIAILNKMPPASQLNLATYSNEVLRTQYMMQSFAAYDVKSIVLSLLVEQMGLAQPDRYAYTVRSIQMAPNGVDLNSVLTVRRNFDPVMLQESSYINEVLYTYSLLYFGPTSPFGPFCEAAELPVDPLALAFGSVASRSALAGEFYKDLTRDDAGGLKYLLRRDFVRFEYLPPEVQSANPNTPLVSGGYRPGIEKITFQRHPTGSLAGEYLGFTNQWTDLYYAPNHPVYQEVKRVMTRPDIVFAAQDLGINLFDRTGTSNWVNHAMFNGNWGGSGPGVIQGPIKITLNNVGLIYLNRTNAWDEVRAQLVSQWGSFDHSTNHPLVYPGGYRP